MHSLLMDINGLIYLPIDSTIMDNPFIYKLVPCQHFLQGMCDKSDAVCKFSHGSMLPLPTYSQPQSYWYNVTLDPTTLKWTLESIPDPAHKKQPAISMATGMPLVARRQQNMQFRSGYQFTGYPGVMGAAPVGFPPMGRQGGGKNGPYQGRAKSMNSSATTTNPQHSSGRKRGKKQLASRQGTAPSHATVPKTPQGTVAQTSQGTVAQTSQTTVAQVSQATGKGNPTKPVDITTDDASLLQSLDSLQIKNADSDGSSVSSWASLSSKVSTSNPIPTFSRTNFPGLPGSNNAGSLSHGAKRGNQSSEAISFEGVAPPRGAWALGAPHKISPAKTCAPSETKSDETSAPEKQN